MPRTRSVPTTSRGHLAMLAADSAGAGYLAEVVDVVTGQPLGTFTWSVATGDYPNDWVAVDFDATDGRTVRVVTRDLDCRSLTVIVAGPRGEAARATFDNLPASLAAAVVIHGMTS